MAEYIEREALILQFNLTAERSGDADCPWDMSAIETEIEAMPSADVVPVVHGRWVARDGRIVCNQCGALLAVMANPDAPEEFDVLHDNFREMFCYGCGARMDGE